MFKKKLKKYDLGVDMFGTKTFLYVGDMEEFVAAANKEFKCVDNTSLDVDENAGATTFRFRTKKDFINVIWLSKVCIKMLSHEVMHVVHNVAELADIKLCRETNEIFAYLYSHYFVECCKALKIISK